MLRLPEALVVAEEAGGEHDCLNGVRVGVMGGADGACGGVAVGERIRPVAIRTT